MFLCRIIIESILLFLLLFLSGTTADLHAPEPVSGAAGGGYDPAVSANGRYLAFTSTVAGNEDIWLLDLRKGEKRKLTSNTSADYSPCFSGNDELVFVSTRRSSGGDIYRSDLKGTNVRRSTGGDGYFDSPSVSPDERIIAYVHSESRDGLSIHFLDTKTGRSVTGPPGLEPSFSPLGRKIVFLYRRNKTDNPVIAIYDLSDSSVTELDTRSMVVSSPAFLIDGGSVVCALHDNDTDGDGIITRNDYSRLIVYSLDDPGTYRWLYPGYRFGDPVVSREGVIYAVSEDGEIFALSQEGAVSMLESAGKQALVCDSLLSHTGNRDDSLFTAAVCLSSFYHYPDSCGDFLLTAADYLSALGMKDIAEGILSGLGDRVSPDLAALAELRKSEISFDAARRETLIKAWREAYDIARRTVAEPSYSSEVTKKAYLHGIEASYAGGRPDEGTELMVEGLLRFTGDEEMTALLEIWRLRFKARDYSGDPMDLVPLYVEYLTRFSGQEAMADTVIEDVMKLTRDMDAELAVNALDNIRRRYPDQGRLGVACLYEQGLRLERSGRPELARWKYEEMIDSYEAYPGYLFQAFSNLGELRLRTFDPAGAEVYFDSARVYLDHAGSAAARTEFLHRYSQLKAMQGYTIVETDPQEAGAYFRESYESDPDNIDAIWGLSRSLSAAGDKSEWEETARTLRGDQVRSYFQALREIARFENGGRVSSLNSARQYLLKTVDQDRKYTPAYLALGYVDCVLETVSGESSGLYEEAVEVSMTGLSLEGKGSSLETAFLLNLGEAYYGLGQYRKAFESFVKALESVSEATDVSGADAVPLKLADSAFQIDSLERAEEIYMDLQSRSASMSNAEMQAFIASRLGLIYQSQNMYVEALEDYDLAFPIYSSRNDLRMMANILKCQAVCYNALGEQERASGTARESLALFEKVDFRRIYDNRMKLSIWPFGLTVPLLKIEGTNYGGSIYPAGLTDAANRALLTRIAADDRNVMEAIETHKSIIEILVKGGEEYHTVDIQNSLGRLYNETGYLDSADAAFRAAYRLAKDRYEYAGAYIQLVDRATCLLTHSDTLSSDAQKKKLEVLRSDSEDLASMIPATYGAARAGLKNIAAEAEFSIILADLDIPDNGRGVELDGWMANLNADAIETMSRLEEVRRLIGEGISEIAIGDEPALVASLSLNEALVSRMLADEDAYNTAMARALNQARLSGSEIVFAEVIGVKGLLDDSDLSETEAMLAESIEIYESLKPGAPVRREERLTDEIYRRAIETSLSAGDSLTALGYLERQRGLKLASIMAANPAWYPKDPLLKALLAQMEDHRRELSRLLGEKRRLIALGKAGLIDLKKTQESILEARSRYLKSKEEVTSMAPSLAATLYLDIDPPEIVCRNIPTDEICLVPFISERGAVIWACDSQGVVTSAFSRHSVELPEPLRDITQQYDIVTLVASGRNVRPLIAALVRIFGDKKLKLAYSLNEAYRQEGEVTGRLDGIGLIAFDGGVINSESRRDIGADVIEVNSVGTRSGPGEYGWLVIDGKFYRDDENPLLSYWEQAVGTGEIKTSRLYLYELYGTSLASFGVILTSFPDMDLSAEKWAALKVFLDSGARTVITMPESIESSKSSKVIEGFFGNLGEMSPLESFELVGRRSGYPTGNRIPTMNYYGDSGWSPAQRKNKAREWYQELVYAGYSAAADGEWPKAVRFFERALPQSELAGLPGGMSQDVTRKMVRGYIELGEFEKALATQLRLIDLCNGDATCRKKEWRRFVQIASDVGDSDKVIWGCQTLLGLAQETNDYSLIYYCYLELAERYLARDELAEAERLMKAPEWNSASFTDSSAVARRDLVRGKLSLRSKNYREAESCFYDAMRLYELTGGEEERYEAMLSLAETFRETDLLLKERSRLTEALAYFRDSGDSLKVAECLNKLAVNYRDSGRLADARAFADEIPTYKPGATDALVLLSDLFWRRGMLDSAYDVAVRAVDASRRRGSPETKARAHYAMGKILESRGSTESASDEYLLAAEFVREEKTGSQVHILEYKYSMMQTVNRDSILTEIADETEKPFIRDLCRYQMALESIRDGDRIRAADFLEGIAGSVNGKSKRYLCWRSLYHLGLMSDGPEREIRFSAADSVYRQYLPEPGYVSQEYALDVRPNDMYHAMANASIDRGDVDEAVVLNERAALSMMSADYLSRGVFDKYENDFLDSCQASAESGIGEGVERLKTGFLRAHPSYRPLWGEPAVVNLEFRKNLDPSIALTRFYAQPDSLTVVYLDADTVVYSRTAVDIDKLREVIKDLPETMRNQNRADSLLEEWYRILIEGFEDLLLIRDQMQLIPDGPLIWFPLEALKMPEGDYLGEMLSTIRGTHLDAGFPDRDTGGYLPCVDNIDNANGDPAMEVIRSVSEAVGGCRTREAGRVRFVSGATSHGPGWPEGEIVCFLDAAGYDNAAGFMIDLLEMRKRGYERSIQTLWPMPDQATAYYYWTLFDKLRGGKGVRESHRAAKSFLYGRYRGSSYYWPSHALYSLN